MIDALSTAESKIAQMKIPLTTISILSHISVTELSAIFNRQRPCGAEKELRIAAAVKALEELANAVAPVPVDFRKSETLRAALDRIKTGELHVVMIDFAGLRMLNEAANAETVKI